MTALQTVPEIDTVPTAEYRPFNNVRIDAYGRHFGNLAIGDDWTKAANFERVATLAQRHRLVTVLVPRASQFNGQICRYCDLATVIKIGQVEIRTGYFADGVMVPRGHGFFLASADCPTFVVWGAKTGTVIAAHAGRDSLFDHTGIVLGRPILNDGKMLANNVIARLEDPREDIYVFSCVGIGHEHYQHRFDDPKYGPGNSRMAEHLCQKYGGNGGFVGEGLDLHELIRLQFVTHGVPSENINRDAVDTGASSRLWHSVKHSHGGKERNGILVCHLP